MRRNQQAIFFLTSFILFFTGNGLYPLLPHFAGGFGASATTTGLFLASLSATNAAGALLASRLPARFSPRQLFVLVSALGVPVLLALSQARTMWLVVVATAMLWFSGGFIMAIVNVLTGLTVKPEARGRAFSRLFLASPVAAIFGGGVLGTVVNAWGYSPGFIVLAAVWAVIPIIGLQVSSTAQEAPAPLPAQATDALRAAPGGSFYLLLVSALTVAAAIHLRNVSAFLQMQSAGFSPAAISSTTVVAGMVTIPVALIVGSLSDRIARRTLMMVTMALVALTLVPLASASELWHFTTGIALLLAATAVLRPATTAVATDLLPPAALQRGLPLVEASMMGTSVVVSAGAGYVLEQFGTYGITFLSAALLLISALSLALLCAPKVVGAVCPIAVRAWRIRRTAAA